MSIGLGIGIRLGQRAASAPSFDPLTLSPAAFYSPGDYAGGTWTKAAGTDLAAAGAPAPTASSGCPSFNGATDYWLANAVPLSTWGGSGNKHMFAVFVFSAITNTTVSPVYQRACLLEASDQYAGMYAHRTGTPGAYQYWLTYYEYDTGVRAATVEITSLLDGSGAGRIVAQGRKTGGAVQVRANSGAWVTGDACGATGGTTGVLHVFGTNGGMSAAAHAVGTWTSALSDADSNSLATWGATA